PREGHANLSGPADTSDAWIGWNSEFPSKSDINHGTDPFLTIDGDGTNEEKTLLRFNLQSIPTGAVIDHATLSLSKFNGEPTALDLYELTTAWSEGSVTWNNRPMRPNTPVVTAAPYDASSESYSIDVASSVQRWVAGPSSNFGWWIDVHTRE